MTKKKKTPPKKKAVSDWKLCCDTYRAIIKDRGATNTERIKACEALKSLLEKYGLFVPDECKVPGATTTTADKDAKQQQSPLAGLKVKIE